MAYLESDRLEGRNHYHLCLEIRLADYRAAISAIERSKKCQRHHRAKIRHEVYVGYVKMRSDEVPEVSGLQ